MFDLYQLQAMIMWYHEQEIARKSPNNCSFEYRNLVYYSLLNLSDDRMVKDHREPIENAVYSILKQIRLSFTFFFLIFILSYHRHMLEVIIVRKLFVNCLDRHVEDYYKRQLLFDIELSHYNLDLFEKHNNHEEMEVSWKNYL